MIVRRKLFRLKVVTGSIMIFKMINIASNRPPISPNQPKKSYVYLLKANTLGSKYKFALENL